MGTVLVARDGQVLFSKGYGFANLESDGPDSPNTKFRLDLRGGHNVHKTVKFGCSEYSGAYNPIRSSREHDCTVIRTNCLDVSSVGFGF